MTPSPRELAELGRLIACLSDGTLSPEEMARLERLLLDNPQAQAFYHQQIALDVELSWLYAEVPPPVPAEEPLEVGRIVNPSASWDGLTIRPTMPSRRRIGKPLLLAIITSAMAAAVLLALFLFRPVRRPAPDAPQESAVARVVELTGEAEVLNASGESSPATAGQDLFAGQTLHTSGADSFAVVEYADGTKLEFHADTSARLLAQERQAGGGKKVFLSRGLLRAEVARQPQGQPLILATPHAQIRVLGTRFASAIAPEATRVELEEGRVQLTRQADGKVIEVEKGYYAVATTLAEPLQKYPLPKQLTQPRALLHPRAHDVAFSPDGTTLATATRQGVLLWDPVNGQKKATLATPRAPRFLAYSPDGTTLAALCEDQMIRLWHPVTVEERPSIKGPERGFSRLAFSPDSQLLACLDPSVPKKNLIRIWEVATSQEQPPVELKNEAATALAFTPNGMLVAGTNKGNVLLYNRATGQVLSTIQGPRRRIDRLTVSADGHFLAMPGLEHHDVSLRDLTGNNEVQSLRGCDRPVTALAFSPDGCLLAGGTVDGNILLWQLDGGQEVLTIRAGKGNANAVAFSRDGQTLVTAIGKQPVQLWSLSGE